MRKYGTTEKIESVEDTPIVLPPVEPVPGVMSLSSTEARENCTDGNCTCGKCS